MAHQTLPLPAPSCSQDPWEWSRNSPGHNVALKDLDFHQQKTFLVIDAAWQQSLYEQIVRDAEYLQSEGEPLCPGTAMCLGSSIFCFSFFLNDKYQMKS